MRYILAALILSALALPARAQTGEHAHPDLAAQVDVQAADAKAQQSLDGTTTLGSNQTAIQTDLATLAGRVTALEAALAEMDRLLVHWPSDGIWYLNKVPQGAGNACTVVSLAADPTVECPPKITDWEGDETTVTYNCTSGTYDTEAEIYTAVEISPPGEPHKCFFMAADPRWGYTTHNSVVTITVDP